MKVLKVLSSVMGLKNGDKSVSNKEVNEIANRLESQGYEVVSRNVVENPVALVNSELFAGLAGDKNFANIASQHNELIEEVLDADMLLISAPMYNFSIPAQLKAYFDAIARAGKTFKYTENGPVGLLKAKKAIVVISRGGIYSTQGFTAQEDLIKMFLRFIGIEQIEFQFIEGIALGNDSILKTNKVVDLL